MPERSSGFAVLLCRERRGNLSDIVLPIAELGPNWKALSRNGPIAFEGAREAVVRKGAGGDDKKRVAPATRRSILAFLERNSIIARMIPRRLLGDLSTALAEAPAVALLGPRQAGKTTLALEVAKTRRHRAGEAL